MKSNLFSSMLKAALPARTVFMILLVFHYDLPPVYAQSDSATLVQAKWDVVRVAPGITLKHCWFDSSLFGSSQNISILEVQLNHHNRIDVAFDAHKLKPTSEFAGEHHAIAAINGTFFNMKEGGSEDYIRQDDHTINETVPRAGGQRSFHQRAAIVIDHNTVRIARWDSSAQWEDHLAGRDVMVSGPLLIDQGNLVGWPFKTGFFGRNPRSALGINGHTLYLVAIDGRNEKAAGMSIDELEKTLHWLKIPNAINLDGGGSTTLWVRSYPYGGVVNHPSDNHRWLHSDAYRQGMDLDNLPADTQKWDHTGERPVANALVIERR